MYLETFLRWFESLYEEICKVNGVVHSQTEVSEGQDSCRVLVLADLGSVTGTVR